MKFIFHFSVLPGSSYNLFLEANSLVEKAKFNQLKEISPK